MNALFSILASLPLAAAVAPPAASAPPPAVRAAATRSVPIRSLVAVRPFRVAEPWTHEYRADRPAVRQGWIVVLDADPALVRPRQTEQMVLMGDGLPLEIVQVAVDAGRVVAILPRVPDSVEIESVVFHLAAPALPESLSVEEAGDRRSAAVAAGITPRGAAEIARARAAGGEPVDAADREAIDREIGAAIRSFMPFESNRADELEGRIDSTPRPVN